MKILRSLSLVILVISLAHFQPASAKMSPDGSARTVQFSFAELGEKELNIRSIYDLEYVNFVLPDGLNITQALLNLHLQHSDQLLPDLSDLQISLNSSPVADIILSPENAADGVISVDIPLETIQPGANELLLRFNQRLVADGCSDLGSKDLWTKVFNDSAISVNGLDTVSPTDLKRFPLPFTSLTTLTGSPQVTFILPDNPLPAELTAAAQVAASLGREARWKTPPVFALTADKLDPNLLAQDALIIINSGDRNPQAGTAAPGLTLASSPYNPSQVALVISGRDESELLKSAAMLVTRSARSQFSGAHIDPVDVKPETQPKQPSRSSFSDLGLASKLIRGIGLHDLYFPIFVPYDWKLTNEASLEIRFTHGTGIASASLMRVFINSQEAASIRLDDNNADAGRLVIQLSPQLVHPGRNWLHVEFDLHMPRENCKFHYFEEAWTQISADQTFVNLAHVVSIAPLDLLFLPSFLIIPDDLGADLLVVPASPSNNDLTAMLRIAAKLGTYSFTDGISIQSTRADVYKPTNQPTNVILFGSPESNLLIQAVETSLPQPLNLVNGSVVPASGRALLADEQAGQAAYLEIMKSPWSRKDNLMVLSSRDPTRLLQLVDLFPSGGSTTKDSGNLIVLTSSQEAGFNLGTLTNNSLSSTSRLLTAFLLIGAFLLVILIGVVLVIRMRKAGKGKLYG